MFKVLIVDDEKPVSDSITFIINKYLPSLEVAGSAKSGKEALARARETQPDIILMDVKMPGMNGLEAIGEIKGFQQDTYFILITAYERFDVAKEAFELSVNDYLLKPFTKEKLIDSLRNAQNHLEAKERQKQLNSRQRQSLRTILPALEHSFIQNLLWGDDIDLYLEQFKQILNISSAGATVVAVDILDKGRETPESARKGFMEQLLVKLRYKFQFIAAPISWHQAVLLFPHHADGNTVPGDKVWQKFLLAFKDSPFRIIRGKGRYRIWEELALSYQEALIELEGQRNSSVWKKTAAVSGDIRLKITAQEKRLVNSIFHGDSGGAKKLFQQLFSHYQQLLKNNRNTLWLRLFEFFSALHYLVREFYFDHQQALEFPLACEELLGKKGVLELKLWGITRVHQIADLIYALRVHNIPKVVSACIKYIKENYASPLTLTDAAGVLQVSPQYLSKIFKERMNKSFVDYLTHVRMEAAKKLFRTTNLTVKEICHDVGYGDPNYFSRIFKKNTGKTPTEFVKVLEKEKRE